MQDGGAQRPPAPPAAQQTPSLTELLDHWGSYPFAKAPVPPYAIRVVKLNKGVDGWGLQLEPEPLSIPPHGKCAIISGCVKGWLADAGGEINDGDALLKVKGENVTNKSIDEIAGILGKAASPLIAQLLHVPVDLDDEGREEHMRELCDMINTDGDEGIDREEWIRYFCPEREAVGKACAMRFERTVIY